MSLYIFRGLPGAGKSKRARELADKLHCMLIEPDALLYHDGEYHYTKEEYLSAWCACMDMLTDIQISILEPDVVFADVLPTVRYVRQVEQKFGKPAERITTLEIDLATAKRRNVHGVADEDLQFMATHFEIIDEPNSVIEDAMDELTYEKDMPEGW